MPTKYLLNPRYEIIFAYPNCPFNVGDILHRIRSATNDWFHTNEFSPVAGIHLETIVKYAHIFRKMEWWEKRKIEDMPEYVYVITSSKCSVSGILKVKRWFVWENWEISQGLFYANFEGHENNYDVQHFIPVTEEEYLSTLKIKLPCTLPNK